MVAVLPGTGVMSVLRSLLPGDEAVHSLAGPRWRQVACLHKSTLCIALAPLPAPCSVKDPGQQPLPQWCAPNQAPAHGSYTSRSELMHSFVQACTGCTWDKCYLPLTLAPACYGKQPDQGQGRAPIHEETLCQWDAKVV